MLDSQAPPPRPARGRPRSAEAHRAVLKAARELVAEGGDAAATIEAIAERSGVAKTTIYRRWPTRPALVVELLLKLAATDATLQRAGGDPVRELRRQLHEVAKAAEGLTGRLLIALLAEADRDAQVREALLRGLFVPGRRATVGVIKEGQRMGLLRREISPDVAADLIFGPFFYRRFMRQQVATRRFLDESFDLVMAAIAMPAPAGRRPTRGTSGTSRRRAAAGPRSAGSRATTTRPRRDARRGSAGR